MDKKLLRINDQYGIPEDAITFKTARSSGPGGQNVNKVESKVRLIYNIFIHEELPADARFRLMAFPDIKLNKDGLVMITEQRGSSQYENKEMAIKLLKHYIRKALIVPKTRKATKPTKVSNEDRLKTKHSTAKKKVSRKKGIDIDEE